MKFLITPLRCMLNTTTAVVDGFGIKYHTKVDMPLNKETELSAVCFFEKLNWQTRLLIKKEFIPLKFLSLFPC